MTAGRYHDDRRRRRRECVWRAVPSRRFMELVGCLVLGGTVDAPDDVADLAVAVARRTAELIIIEGERPDLAYEQAISELLPEWGRRR